MEKESPPSSPHNPGRQTVLSELEEIVICAHVIALANTYGFPTNKLELRLSVKNYLTRIGRTVTEFKDNLSGKKWINMFLGRHKKLSMRVSQGIRKAKLFAK
ncbi:hypothetical protein WA026_001258 [Henosepilachna vigintioctopunctata]|uniref:Uncharacterized protein n=1 Tax=Henosepilachna vigintioctopunctata TaxID=420089 RepID=A0AAW1UPU9_9CUCU